MSDRSAEHTQLLELALTAPHGIILRLEGGDSELPNRQTAISSLQALKRQLTADIPEMLNLQIKPVPGDPTAIAIQHLKPIDEGED